ncbi:glycerol-3-phosphate dehydrogenase/oxidase [Pukyongiella litopenaei]|uniref:glycerol-3-phosphate dehydrogenase/oxidase n=1 Tax=Pukyongiella litopenaei TaxID=2605946 RepID=UPI001FCEED4F|nr:glycerol-3-phosphate dehydrogenase/oxidase [Pukyongiella litopenaei]
MDVVIVGGGVNGIGVYRDLALQGLRVLLIERNDFCSGCSAAPSRMIHGGLRYLENGEFDLVRESLQERDALLRNAPHMVRPLPTMIPITSLASGMLNAAAHFFGHHGKPANRGAIPIKIGLTLYDWVSRKRRAIPKHRFHSRRITRRTWPELTQEARRSVVYHDAWISHPERLCIEMLRDTTYAAPGSVALNYAELRNCDGRFSVIDGPTGEVFEINPRVIVNATGAWVDDTARTLSGRNAERMVSGTKGSHLILENAALYDALNGHMVFYENTDGRVCIVFPYLGKVLAGSTDLRTDKVARVRCEPEELDYILGSLRLVFPGIDVSPRDVVFSYSGIRPLPMSDADFTGRISRGHSIRRIAGAVPQFCMIGGKWTTFRAFAEEAGDEVLRELGKTRRISTLDLPIGGGFGYDETDSGALSACGSLAPDRVAHLREHYGSQATEIAAFCMAHNGRELTPATRYFDAEIAWILTHEYALTLSDIVLRRTDLAITGQISGEIIDRIGAIMARTCGLTTTEIEDQKQSLTEELAAYHGVSADMLAARNRKDSLQ